MPQLSPAELTLRLQAPNAPLVLDVREPWEFATCAIAGATHVPMREIAARLADLDSEREIVCVCHHGMRSMQVGVFLARNGFERVYNLAGGIDAWAREVELTMPRY
ncbi:MAG: rhodanese-like domain-containing protein [Burkholderiaceae bacterium]